MVKPSSLRKVPVGRHEQHHIKIQGVLRRTRKVHRGFQIFPASPKKENPEIRHKANLTGAGPQPQQRLPNAPLEKAIRSLGGANGQLEPSWDEETSKPSNPLKGNSLGVFSPESRLRNCLCDLLVYRWTEPLILLLIVVQTILLAVDAAKNVYLPGNERPKNWGGSKIDFAMLALFILFTLEIAARVIVSGFVFNPPEYGSGNGKRGIKTVVAEKYRAVFAPQRQASLKGPWRAN